MAVPETTDTENKGFSITTFLSETKVELKKGYLAYQTRAYC